MAKGRWQASYQTPAPLGPRAGLALDQHGKVPVGRETPSTHSIRQTRVTCPSRASLSALGCAPALPPTASATGVHPGLQGLWCPSPCTPLHTPSCQPRFSMRVEGPEGAAVVCPLARVTPPHDFQVTGFSSVTTAFLLQTGSGSRARFSPLGSAALRLKGIRAPQIGTLRLSCPAQQLPSASLGGVHPLWAATPLPCTAVILYPRASGPAGRGAPPALPGRSWSGPAWEARQACAVQAREAGRAWRSRRQEERGGEKTDKWTGRWADRQTDRQKTQRGRPPAPGVHPPTPGGPPPWGPLDTPEP